MSTFSDLTMSVQQVFILGSPRSGTSALAWAMARHPKMWTSAESDFLLYLFRDEQIKHAWEKSVIRSDGGWLHTNRVDYPEFAEFIGVGIDALFRSRSKGRIWVDQTPGYTLMSDILKEIFPRARFVHIVRDGRSVVSSMLSSNFEKIGFKMKWATDFKEACKTWKVYANRGHQFVKENPNIAVEIRQEDLLAESETVLGDLIEFLNLSPSSAPAKFIMENRLNSSYDIGGKTVVDAKQKFTKETKYRNWRDWSNREKREFDRIAGEILRALEYSPELE